MSDAIEALADFVLSTRFADLPEAVVAATKHQVLDTLGIALAAACEDGVRELREFEIETGGTPEALIWGTAHRVPAQHAARVNATAAHALDYDDTYERSFLHPAVITIPAAIATAELVAERGAGGVSGPELITAIAVGVDVACRLSNSAQPGVAAFDNGWHNTSLYGYFSTAMVAGRLLGLTRNELISAAGIVLHQAGGNAQAHVDGALTKRMGPGLSSYAGIVAARLAQRGVRGATNVLEGVRGFYTQYHRGHYSREALLDGLGRDFATPDCSFKPWPSCRGSHTAADAALALFTSNELTPAAIERVTVFNAPGEYSLLSTPIEKKRAPGSVVDAQFSIPWVVTAALVDHRIGLDHFTPAAIERPDLLAAVQLIDTVSDDSLARPGGGVGAARVEARLRDGRTVSAQATVAKGEPSNPLSTAELHQKFSDCTRAAGLSEGAAAELVAQVDALNALPSVDRLTDCLRGS